MNKNNPLLNKTIQLIKNFLNDTTKKTMTIEFTNFWEREIFKQYLIRHQDIKEYNLQNLNERILITPNSGKLLVFAPVLDDYIDPQASTH